MGLMLMNNIKDAEAKDFNIALINAPSDFIEFTSTSSHMTYKKIKDKKDYRQSLINGEYDALIEFPKDYSDAIQNYQTKSAPHIVAYCYDKNNYITELKSRLENTMSAYSKKILHNRFTSESSYHPFDFKNELISFDDGKSSVNELLATLIPMLLTTFIFSGAMSIGMDSFAGEKERGTMATLLMTTSPRQAIVVGKMLSLAIVAILSTLSSLLALFSVFQFAKVALKILGESIDINYALTYQDTLLLLLCLFGLIAVFAAIISITSLFAKNLKEANSYISPLFMLVMLMGYSTMMSNAEPKNFQKFVPILSNVTNMKLIFLGKSNVALSIYALVSSIAVSVALTIMTSKMLQKEKFMF